MKQPKQYLTLLLLMVGTAVWGKTYKLEHVTSVEAGSLYVFEQGGYVMDKSISSSALQTVTGYKTTGLVGNESYVWMLEGGTNGFYMKNMNLTGNKYLTNTSSTSLSLANSQAKSSVWAFDFQTDETVLIQNTSNGNRFLGYTTSNSYAYKAYATQNLDSYPHAIKVYKLVEEEQTYTVTAVSNNDSYGTVVFNNETNNITATPFDGYRVSETNPYTVTSGEATVHQNGNTFTVTTTADCTVRINFEEIPVTTNIFVKSDSAPYIYTWKDANGSTTKYNGDWPGTQMSDTWPDENGVTWYTISIPTKGFNMILNTGNGTQTGNIENISENTYFVWNADGYPAYQYQKVQLAEVTVSNKQLNKNETTSCIDSATPNGLTFSYSSSDTSVASVADGMVTGVSEGTATITVNWNTQQVESNYYAGGSKTFTVTVRETNKQRYYEKITSANEIKDGMKYLIVYGTESRAFDGSRETLDAVNNYAEVTIDNNQIETNQDIYFVINSNTQNGYTIQSASGYYIGRTTYSNGLETSTTPEYNNSISFEDGNVKIQGSGGVTLSFNSTSGQERFRYFKNLQQPIQLYKEVIPEVTIYVKSDMAPYIYTWTGDGATATKYTGDWPGTQATETEEKNGVTWYKMTVPAKGFNLILNNGYSGESNQTANINNITEDTYYVWNSAADNYGANQYLAVKLANVTASDVTVREGNTVDSDIDATPEGLVFTYSSSDESVATVASDGKVTGTAAGTATITASWATQVVNSQGYLGGSVTYTVSVTPAPEGGVFVKAMSVNELQDGMEVIIVNEEFMKTMGQQQTNNFLETDVEIYEDTSPHEASLVGENTTILILEKSGDFWYFKVKDEDENEKYLYAASSGNNYLKTQTDKNDNAKASISIDDFNDAVIIFQGGNSRNVIRYNKTSTLFSCYDENNSQYPVQIYYREAQDIIARPTITPAAGTYTEAQEVTITNNAEGATVYYTTDGTKPTTSSTTYTGPFTLNRNGTYVIKAIASNGENSSAVATARIVIQIPVEAPVIAPASGTQITEETGITITCSDESLSIYYTTDGSDPVDGQSNLTGTAKAYTGEFNMAKAGTVKAVTIDADGNASVIVSATYTYNGTVTLPYYERFDAGLGNFIAISNGETGSDELVWDFRKHYPTPEFLAKYGEERKYAYASNGKTAQTASGTTRLVSPIVDLTTDGLTNVMFNFIHAGRYFSTEDIMKATCRVQIITDDGGKDISSTDVLSVDGNWTDITIPDDGWFDYTSTTFPRTNSGDISLDDYVGKKVRICFLFDATSTSNYGTWNVDQISIRGELVEKVDIKQPEGASGEGYASYVLKNDIDAATTFTEKGVKLYKVVEFDKRNVVLVQLGLGTGTMGENTYSETVAPAGSPVLVKAGFGENDLVLVNSDEVVPKLRGNLLRSAVDGVTATEDDHFFVLQYPKSVGAYGFYLLSAGRSFEGRKAYLNGVDEVEELTTQTNAKQGIFYFGEEDFVESIPTGIENVERTTLTGAPNGIYDLTGRKVADVKNDLRLPKGIYVVNGKKMVVK